MIYLWIIHAVLIIWFIALYNGFIRLRTRTGEAWAKSISADSSGNIKDLAQAENMLTGALKSLFAVSEAYPDLKANVNFLELQRELSDTENKIQAARRFYNGNVRDLNIKVETFPSNMVAKMFNFAKKEFFDIPDAGPESQPVAVKF